MTVRREETPEAGAIGSFPARAAPRARWWYPLTLAVSLGAAAGFFHVAVVLFRRNIQNQFTWTSRDILWMSPVANILLLMGPAIVTALLVALWPHGRVWRVSVALLAALAAVSALLAIRGLHTMAVLLLGLGVAVQLTRAEWTPRRLLSGTMAAIAGIGVAALLSVIGRDRAPTDVTASPGAPNVLVLILDTVRAASTSLHGYARPTTPNIDQLAAQGAMFELAIAPSSWTLPSHAAMFTGLHASRLSATWRRPLDDTQPVVAEIFREHGYATGAFVGNPFYTHHESGLGRGFDVLRDFRRSKGQLFWSTPLTQTAFVNDIVWGRSLASLGNALRSFDLEVPSEPKSDRRRAGEIIDEFLRWRDGTGQRPFFAFLNLYDAHDPYEPPQHVRTRFSASPGKQDLYDAGIAYMDDEIARLVSELERRGIMDETLIVITSDHGEQWGEHGLHNHGNSLYLPAVHVPLVMRLPPRIAAGTRVRQAASLTDLAATLLDAAGVTGATIPGQSLLRSCCGTKEPYDQLVVTETEQLDPSARSISPAHRGPLASLVWDSLQYVRNGDSSYDLFDVRHDYGQVHDLLQDSASCGIAVRLDSLLRGVSREPATPALTDARCAALHARVASSTNSPARP